MKKEEKPVEKKKLTKRQLKLKKRTIIINCVLIVACLLITVFCVFVYKKNTGVNHYLKIKLNGEKEINIKYGEKYEDEGAKATYNKKDLSSSIRTSSNVNFDRVGYYKITYTIKYKQKTKKVVRKVNVLDEEKPELVLNGSSEVTIQVGDTYKEEFAKATDNYDGDLSEAVVITGDVDTGKVGEYTIVYTVSDSSDNKVSIERKVKVIEKTAQKPVSFNNSEIIGKTSKGYTIEKKDGVIYINGILIANKTYSLPRDYNPGDLLDVFTENFNKMQSDASKEGISLNVISGFRSYDRQNNIYNNYVSRDGKDKADTYSARPGHSEHQTGLAADINDLSQSWENTAEGKWLNANCYKYGFIIRYVKGKEDQTGYIYEPWHIRYVGNDLAKKLYNNGDWLTLEEYLGITSKY